MNIRLACGLAACLMGSLCLGCSSGGGVIRGQSPNAPSAWETAHPDAAVQQAIWGGGPAQMVHGHTWHSAGHPGHGCPDGMCPHGGWGPGAGLHGLAGAGLPGLPGLPKHHTWFTYREPKNLVYPPAAQPGGVVQYPYYTVKGPDDFFLQ